MSSNPPMASSDFLALSDNKNTPNNNGNRQKFNPYHRNQNNQYNNRFRNQRGNGGGNEGGQSANFSPHGFSSPNNKQNFRGFKQHNNYNQGRGGRNNRFQNHNKFNRGNRPMHGQNNEEVPASKYFHPSMIEDPWKYCHGANTQGNNAASANDKQCSETGPESVPDNTMVVDPVDEVIADNPSPSPEATGPSSSEDFIKF